MKPPRSKLHNEDERPAPRLWPWGTENWPWTKTLNIAQQEASHRSQTHTGTHTGTHVYLVWEAICHWDSLGTLLACYFTSLAGTKCLQNFSPTNPCYFPHPLKQHSHIFILTGIILESWSLRFTRITQQKEVTHLNTPTTKMCAEGESFTKPGWAGRHVHRDTDLDGSLVLIFF